jgi:hypothetical protein
MVTMDLQLPVEQVLRRVRNELRQHRFCVPDVGLFWVDQMEIPTTAGFDGVTATWPTAGYARRAADKVEHELAVAAPGGWDLVTVDYHPVELVVPLRLHLTTRAAVLAGSPPITSDAMIFAVLLRLMTVVDRGDDASAPVSEWSVVTNAKPTGIDWSPAPGGGPGLDAVLDDATRTSLENQVSAVGSQSIPLGLGPIKQLLGDLVPLDLFNSGLTCDVAAGSAATGSRLVIRWQANGPAGSAAEWIGFLESGSGEPAPVADGFGYRFPAGLLVPWAEEKFRRRLESKSAEEDAEFEVLEWPEATWTWPFGQLQTTFDVNVFSPGPCPNDIGVTVTVDSMAAAAAGGIQVTNTLTRDAYNGDVWVCAGLELALPDAAGAILTGIVAANVADSVSADLEDKIDLDVECQWTQPDDEITCLYPVTVSLAGAAAGITSVTADAGGLILGGFLDVVETGLPPLPFLVPPAKPLEWHEHDICHHLPPFVRQVLAKVWVPAKLCGWEVVDDDLHVFDTHIELVSGPGYVALVFEIHDRDVVPIADENDLSAPHAYYDDPYPLRAIVRTTEGIALLDAGVLPLPPARMDLSDPHVQLLRVLRCTRWIDFTAQHEYVLKGKWWPDPPDEVVQPERRAKHQWAVSAAGGVDDGEVESSSGAGSASAAVEGPVEDLIVAPAGTAEDSETDISIRFGGVARAVAAEQAEASIRLGVGQRRVSLAAHYLHAGLRAFRLLDGGAPTLACVDGDGITMVEVLNPDIPRPVARLELAGLRGVAEAGAEQIAVWGADGVWLLSRSDLTTRSRLAVAGGVVAIEAVEGLLALLSDRGVDLVDRAGRPRQHLDTQDATSVLGLGRRLVVGGRTGIGLWDSRDGVLIDFVRGIDVTALSAVPARRLVPAVLGDGTTRLFALSRTALVPRATLRGDDWYATTLVAGPVAGQAAPGGVQLLRVGPLRQLSREQLESWAS